MPKIAKELSALEVKRLTKAGMHAVGNPAGLLLQIHKPVRATSIPARSWILRIRIAGDRQHIGIGPYPTVALAEAREEAKKIVGSLRQGVNPKNEKKRKRSALIDAVAKNKTFKECAEAYIAAHSAEFSNEKHRKQWSATLESYAYPIIGDMLVADISMRNVLAVLKQDIKDPKTNKTLGAFWETKTTTASRLQGRIKTILDFTIVNEYRQGPNPALWSGYLDTQLAAPAKIKKVKHHPAIPYPQIGDFMVQLRKNESISAKALQFLILTAVRSGSVRSADWSEINLENKLWIIPAGHTKTKQEHRVPLSDQAIALLNSLPKLAVSAKIFPSLKGKSLSDMALSQLMRGMKERKEFNGDGVPHGFRSTFRDWGAEQTIYPDEIRKSASGHTVGNAVQKAYQRTDLLEKRRQLMIQWAKFLEKPSVNKTSKVKPIRSAA